ncbi:hypothetical protein [Pedobacter sp. KLB.chiD]|uniref:hypothetical protein n=1 Tax=Pedobacter sp. KLB.chiD TaxID=3387402 RepID=UPI00399BBD4A
MNKLTFSKGKAMVCLILMCLLLVQSCKKELLLPKETENSSTDKIRSISYSQFVSAIDLNSTGSLKAVLSGQKAKVMSTQALPVNLDLEMDSVKRLSLGDTISYVIAIKPQTPRATAFQNLTIQVIKTKTSAFLSTYYPDKEWIDNWRKNLKTTFEGTVVFNKINLEDVNSGLANGLEKKQTGLKDRMLASINGKSGLGNVISLLPGECEIYDIVTVVQVPCKHGHLSRSECNYFDYYGTWEPRSDDWPPSTSINTTTVVNCAMPNLPSDGGGGGGGSTTPNTPGTYNPCDGTPQPVGPGGISFERGTRLMVAAPTDCDEISGPPVITTTQTPQQYFINYFDPNGAELSFINNPLNGEAVIELSKYLIKNGSSIGNTNFIHWAIGHLSEDNSRFNQAFRDFLNSSDDAIDENENTNSSLNLNIPSNFTPTFSSNGFGVFTTNGSQTDTYPETHPVSVTIANYNQWIYRALIGANNTSVKHLHLNSKGLAASDAYAKAIGAIGEGIFAQRVTTEYPTSPGGNMYIGYYINTTHIDALQEHYLPGAGGSYYGLLVNYTDINGNPLSKKFEYPDPSHSTTLEKGRIAYEIKTNNVNRNSAATLYQTFMMGINQTVHRANIRGIDASVLVMDYDAWKKLLNSSYGQQVVAKLNEVYNIKNDKNEQKIFIRIQKNLWSDANKAYWDILGKIKNL